jgi:hypothetical protein
MEPKPSRPGSRGKPMMDGLGRREVSDEDRDWRLLTYQQFLRSYADEDAIYDEYGKHRAG